MSETELLRLNKALAAAGYCSRRQADTLIVAGRVSVNGRTVTELGIKVDPRRDTLAVDGRPVAQVQEQPEALTLMFLSLVRMNAPPLPGLTWRNSTIS